MQIIEVTKKTYPNGDRVDVTETFISNGYREPSRRRRTYEFTASDGRKIISEDDIVSININNMGLGRPTPELIKQYPDLEWASWFDHTEDGRPITEALEDLLNE